MTFKEQMEKDVSIFVNADEFADMHVFDGKKITAVVEGLTTKEQLSKTPVTFDGIDGETIILHCAATELEEVPKRGISVELDGEIYTVRESVNDFGVATITLGRDDE